MISASIPAHLKLVFMRYCGWNKYHSWAPSGGCGAKCSRCGTRGEFTVEEFTCALQARIESLESRLQHMVFGFLGILAWIVVTGLR